MLKYVAILKVDEPDLWSRWHSMPTARFYRSDIETDKKIVEEWLENEKKKYPDARINIGKCDRKYLIYTTIIAFDENESENIELFLEKGVRFSNKI